jgi:hypothetical protein
MDARSAFKFGFVARCLNQGMTPAQIATFAKEAADRLEKRAGLGALLSGAAEVGKDVAGKAIDLAKPAVAGAGLMAAVAPPILGAAGGHALGRLTDFDEREPEEVAQATVINELRQQTEQLQRLRRMRALAAQPR